MTAVSQPSGTVTLVFTDIEGSTKLLDELGMDAYRDALAEHRRIVREACSHHSGYEVDYEGDAFFYAFASAQDAVSAVSEAMAGLEHGPISIRVGIHTGEPGLDAPKYVGIDVHTAARIMASAHGGQVVVSPSTYALLPDDLSLTDLGEHRFKDLSAPERIYQLGEGSFPPLKTLYRTNLPVPQTPFLGRERELGEVMALLAREGTRLVTLTGPGGTGKTRLALQAAAEASDDYPDGVCWVALAPLRDADLVLPTVAQSLSVRERAGVPALDALAEHVDGKRMLVLLDNCEQVVGAAPALSELLARTQNLKLLVTSRETLRLGAEVEYAVPTLASQEAITLFCERARVEPSDEIAELCTRLDDLPLAIELAAARVKLLTPTQLLERLAQRLDLLKGGRDADPRQQTLRATIAWSHDLLSADEQALFRRLSVFRGGCTLEAAEAVCDADLDTLESLLDKSILRRREVDGTDPHFWMLETIREFAGERLEEAGETARLGERHARWYGELANQSRDEWLFADAAGWFDRMEVDLGNMRGAVEWGIGRDNELALTMLADTWMFWPQTGRTSEAKRLLEAAWMDGVDIELQKRALRARGALAMAQNDSVELAEISLKRIELARATSDSYQEAAALNMLASAVHLQGEIDEARRIFAESITLFEAIGHEEGLSTALGNLGRLERDDEQYERSHELLERQLAIVRSIGGSFDVAWTLKELAATSVASGRPQEAAELLLEAFDLSVGPGSHSIHGDLLATAGELASAIGRKSEAAVLFGAMSENFEEDGFEVQASTTWWWRLRTDLVEHLGDGTFRSLELEGRSLGDARAISLAHELVRDALDR